MLLYEGIAYLYLFDFEVSFELLLSQGDELVSFGVSILLHLVTGLLSFFNNLSCFFFRLNQ
jgi:hypothetical protein